jgi:hypothetical protein
MNKSSALLGWLAGISTGAAAMYFFDPDRGARRRAIAGDKIGSSARRLSRTLANTRKDLANRGYGFLIESKHRLSPGDAPDAVIEERVRSKMGRIVSWPHGIKVHSDGGNIRLSGTVLDNELPALLRCVRSVAGVKMVESDLQAITSWESIFNQRSPTSDRKDDTEEEFKSDRPETVH